MRDSAIAVRNATLAALSATGQAGNQFAAPPGLPTVADRLGQILPRSDPAAGHPARCARPPAG
ncbi:hypothetical protein ACGFI9_37105 [Micromonospora sp. NPDC048930]|uniref:hypothetical protein n=1 Tax=Micromonospora sp. NPDC048930 TaxID=3364261 RepID=UPI003723199F